MKIFRIENAEGYGPYHIETPDYLMNHNMSRLFPAIWEDWPSLKGDIWQYPEYKEYYCGFDSMDKLTDWFTDYQISQLIMDGYTIVEYEVDESDVVHGKSQKQVFFKKPITPPSSLITRERTEYNIASLSSL